MQWIVIVALAMVAVQAEDDCGPPPMGQKRTHPGECCSAGESIASKVKESVMKCMDKYPRPQGPRPTGPPATPTPEMKTRRTCMDECVYSEVGVMTSDKQLDKAAMLKMFADSPDSKVISAAIEKCFASYKSQVDDSLECKSGASEFNKCVQREVFLNCPADKWTSSTDCDDLKTRVTKCPNMPLHMGGPHMMHKQ